MKQMATGKRFHYASRGSSRQDGIIGGMRSTTTAYGYPIANMTNQATLFSSDTYGTRFTVPAFLSINVLLTTEPF
jgi:hypothetical protein